MSQASIFIVFGSACIGWLIPEFLLMFSSDRIVKNPIGINMLCSIGIATIVAGLRM